MSATADTQNDPLQVLHIDQLCLVCASVAIYLVNGIRLRGTILAFDNHTILLSGGTVKQLVYKHAISTIVVERPKDEAVGTPGDGR